MQQGLFQVIMEVWTSKLNKCVNMKIYYFYKLVICFIMLNVELSSGKEFSFLVTINGLAEGDRILISTNAPGAEGGRASFVRKEGDLTKFQCVVDIPEEKEDFKKELRVYLDPSDRDNPSNPSGSVARYAILTWDEIRGGKVQITRAFSRSFLKGNFSPMEYVYVEVCSSKGVFYNCGPRCDKDGFFEFICAVPVGEYVVRAISMKDLSEKDNESVWKKWKLVATAKGIEALVPLH